MKCGKCGVKNTEENSFCCKCGTQLKGTVLNSQKNGDRKELKTIKNMLIIIAVCVAIIASFFVYFAYRTFKAFYGLPKTNIYSQVEGTKAGLRGVQSALEMYWTHNKSYPNDLEALKKEGYLNDGRLDAWNNPIRYQPLNGKVGQITGYLLGSNGPDGKLDTDDDIEPPINTSRHTFKKSEVGDNTKK